MSIDETVQVSMLDTIQFMSSFGCYGDLMLAEVAICIVSNWKY